MSIEKIKVAALNVLIDYMGIGAEFLMEDVMDEVRKTPHFERDPKIFEMYFFLALKKVLPPEIPFEKVKNATLKALRP